MLNLSLQWEQQNCITPFQSNDKILSFIFDIKGIKGKMSITERSSLRNSHKLTQSHTKNRLMNDLINQKLQQEKEHVKNRFTQIVKHQSRQQESQVKSGIKIRRRSSSLKSINVSIDKIRESLGFDSVKGFREEEAFVVDRQYRSPILREEDLKELVNVRLSKDKLEVRIGELNEGRVSYEDIVKDETYNHEQRVRQMQDALDNQLWLPSSPHTQALLQHLAESDRKLMIPNTQIQPVVKSSVFSSYNQNLMSPIKTSTPQRKNSIPKLSMSPSGTKLMPILIPHFSKEQIAYDFRKYHKEDYLALQKWFQKSVEDMHMKCAYPQHQPKSAMKSIKKSQFEQQQLRQHNKRLLNGLYAVHIGGFQEYMRLCYIEGWQKALVLQKLFWSLLRLFNALIQQQHRVNSMQQRTLRKQMEQQRILYSQRCNNLQKLMIRAQNQSASSSALHNKLSLAYATYSRINRHLCAQLQEVHRSHKELSNSFDFLNLKMMKLLELLQGEDKVKVIKGQEEKVYYLRVGNGERLQEVVRIRMGKEERKYMRKKAVEREVEDKLKGAEGRPEFRGLDKQEMKAMVEDEVVRRRELVEREFAQQEENVFSTRVGERIRSAEHELTKYWLFKQSQLNLAVSAQLLSRTTCQSGTSTLEKFQSYPFGCQFPQTQEQSFQQFLKQQLQKQKEKSSKELSQKEDLYLALKQLYEESYEKVRRLQQKNRELILQVKSKEKEIMLKEAAVRRVQTQMEGRVKDISQKEATIHHLKKQVESLTSTISQLTQQKSTLALQLSHQQQNNLSLVTSTLHLKQKLQKSSIRQNQLQSTLQQLQAKITSNQNLEQRLSQTIKQWKEKYEKLHEKLIKVTPAVENFMEYKRHDKDSIIISNVKKELEKHLGEYFLREGDTFLTKG